MSQAVLASSNGIFGIIKNVLAILPGALAQHDVLNEDDGTNWRYFKFYSSRYVVIKEA